MQRTTNLHTLNLSLDIVRLLAPLVREIARHDRSLADQLGGR